MKVKTLKSIKEVKLGHFYRQVSENYFYICLSYAGKKRLACLNIDKDEAHGNCLDENVLLKDSYVRFFDLVECHPQEVIYA